MRFKALVVAALAVLVASSAYAGKAAQVGVNGGLSIPLGDLSDAAGIGFHIGGEYTYMMNEQLGLGGDLVYHKLGSKDVTFGTFSASSEFSVLQYTVHGKYMMPTSGDVKPYLKVGLGLYSGKATVDSNVPGAPVGESTSTDFGLNFGGGADWKINDKMGWGLNGAYHYISSEGDAATMITLSAGLHWGFGY